MANGVALDTSFLIDLQRERQRGSGKGPAHRWLSQGPDTELHLSVIALGEFAEGFDRSDDPVLRTVRELHVLLPVDEKTALEYGRIAKTLRKEGCLIGTNDLWIAATSRRHDLPLVTGNPRDFRRIENLDVIGYR